MVLVRGIERGRRLSLRWAVASMALTVTVAAPAVALPSGVIPIFASPGFDPATNTGFTNFVQDLQNPARFVGAGGVAIGSGSLTVDGVNMGNRAIRWDSRGAVFLLPAVEPTLPSFANATAVNGRGEVVGSSPIAPNFIAVGIRATRWDATGTPRELIGLGTTPGGNTTSTARSINDAGVVVGTAMRYESGVQRGFRAVRWNVAGAVQELPTLGTDGSGVGSASATAVSASGVVLGRATKYEAGLNRGTRVVRWDQAGNIFEYAAPWTGPSGTSVNETGFAINDSGVVAGFSTKFVGGIDRGLRAVRWTPDGSASELPVLGTDAAGNTRAEAYDVNASGVVVGYVTKYTSGVNRGTRPVRWTMSGVVEELTVPGIVETVSNFGSALSINDSGFIVGGVQRTAGVGSLPHEAMVWRPDNSALVLSSRLPAGSPWVELTRATGLTRDGWVTGVGRFDPDGIGAQAGYVRGFLTRVHPDALRLAAPATLPDLGTVSLGTVTDFPAGGPEDGRVSINGILASTATLTVGLDLAGSGDLSGTIRDLTFVSGGTYTVSTDPATLAALGVSFGGGFDAVVTFNATTAAAFSWDFRGLNISLDRLVIVPEPVALSLLAPALILFSRRRRA